VAWPADTNPIGPDADLRRKGRKVKRGLCAIMPKFNKMSDLLG